MGRKLTPKYVIVMDGKADQSLSWFVRDNGDPNEKNLEKFVMAYSKSLESGGVNAHISESLGHIPYPRRAEIRFNYRGGATVAEWAAGAFQVYG